MTIFLRGNSILPSKKHPLEWGDLSQTASIVIWLCGLSCEIIRGRNSWLLPKRLALFGLVRRYCFYMMQISSPACPYSSTSAPAFAFSVRSYLPPRPELLDYLETVLQCLWQHQRLPWKELSCPQPPNKCGSEQLICLNLHPLWTLGVPSFQFSWTAGSLFVYC